MLFSKRASTLLILSLMAFGSLAQLSTDRPSQSLGTTVIDVGRFQFETGFQIDGNSGQTSTTYNTPLIRYGVSEFFEVRLFTSLLESSGLAYTPLSFGFKSKLTEEKGVLPEISFAGHVAIPGGSDEFSSQEYVPTFRITANHSLGTNWSLGYNWGMDWNGNDNEVANAWTLIVGSSLSEKIGWFGEVYGFVANNQEDFGIDTGFTYLLANRLQLDASGGVGLTSGIPDWFFNTGISLAVGN